MATATTKSNATVNGIDTRQLKATIDAVKADPKQGKTGFSVTTRWEGGTKTRTDVDSWTIGGVRKPRGFVIRTDEPPELLGEGVEANPQEVLMAGLNSCMTVGYAAGCAMLGIELDSLEIETKGELDLRGFLAIDAKVKPGYHELEYTVRIKGSGTPEQFRQVHELVMKTSPNYSNLATEVKLKPRLVVE